MTENEENRDFYSINQQLQVKCSKLEESLRNETIHSEEQRSYIEILKQTLEEKLITNELWTDCKEFKGKKGNSPVDFFVEFTKMKRKIEEKDHDFEEIYRCFEENKEQLENARNLNEEFEKKYEKLTEEKESLLEYLDELKGNFERIEQQNMQYEGLISALSHEKEEFKSFCEDLKREIEEKSEENNRICEELFSEKALGKEIEIHRQKLLKKTEEIEEEIADLKKNNSKIEFERLSREIDRINEEKTILSEEKEDLLEEKATLLEKLRNSNANFSTISCTLQETQCELDKALEKSRFFNENLIKTEEIQKKFRELELENLSLKEEFEGISQGKLEEIQRIENDRQRKMEEIKGFYQQLSQNREEIRDLKEEITIVQKENMVISQEIANFKEQNEWQKARISGLEGENQEYKRLLQERDINSAKLHTLSIKYQTDKDFFEENMKEFRRKNVEISQENEFLRKEINENKEKFQENFERNSCKNSKNSMEQAIKYVNSMIMDLKRHLGTSKLTRNNEKFDLESSLLELHELIIISLEKLEEINTNSYAKRALFEEKNEEIKSLKEKLQSFEANFERNIEIFEKEKEEIVDNYEKKHREIINELKKSEEIHRENIEKEAIFESDQMRETVNKLKKEKAIYEYLLKKFKGILIDEETRKSFEELIMINFEIFDSELKKTELQVKFDQMNQLKFKENYKENLYEIQKSLERLYSKKNLLENDLQKIELIDRKKLEEIKGKKLTKTNSDSNLRAIYEETRGNTDYSLISLNKNFESKLSSIKDEKIANKPQIYKDFSSSKYVSYQDKQEKVGGFYEKTNSFNSDANPIYNNLNELRSKFSKKPWKVGLGYYEEK